MKKLLVAILLTLAMVVSGFANTCTNHVYQSSDGKGDLLIWPVYYAGSGVETRISMVNTDPTNSVVYKVVFRSHGTSIELLDFFVYLSPHDTVDFTVKYSNGKYVVESTDDSIYDGSNWGKFSAELKTYSCDSSDLGYIEAFQAGAFSLGASPVTKSNIKAAFDAATGVTAYSNLTAGKAEMIFNNDNEYASYNAYAFKDYQVNAKLSVSVETFLGSNANNNLAEVEAAMAKTNFDFYNFEGSIYPIITLPTKLIADKNCTSTTPRGPFFTANTTSPTYTVNAYDTQENTKVSKACSVSPCPTSSPNSLSDELNVLSEDTFATKGWEDFSFAQTTTSTALDGSALSYNGIPALALNFVIDSKGIAFIKPSFTPSPVTCAGTVYNNYYSSASAASSSGGSGGGSSTTVTDCSQYTDATSCAANSDCTASTDFFGNFQKCILNCGQYTSQTNCEAAFDGNSCSWNSTFGTCGVK